MNVKTATIYLIDKTFKLPPTSIKVATLDGKVVASADYGMLGYEIVDEETFNAVSVQYNSVLKQYNNERQADAIKDFEANKQNLTKKRDFVYTALTRVVDEETARVLSDSILV